MAIVKTFPTSLYTPDVLVREAEPQPAISGTGIGVVGVLVQAIRGPVNTPTLVSDLGDYVRKFGGYDKNVPDIMFIRSIFQQGATAVKVVRVTDGAEKAASGTLPGAASGSVFRTTTPGTWGNSVTLTITASQVTGYVDLTFSYGAQEVYTYPQVTFTSTTDARYVETVIAQSGDNFVEFATIGTVNPASGTVTFAGGVNGTVQGTAVNDTAYVGTDGASGKTGLVAFEPDDSVNFVCSARANDTINAALLTHVNNDLVSPRIAILAPAQGTTVSALATAMAAINTDRAIMAYPWLQVVNPYNGKKEYYTPAGFYAGVLSTLSYEQSPSRKQIQGIVGTERVLSNTDVDTLGKNRVSPITLMNGIGFVIRNGYNCSAEPAKRNTTRRRAVNYFAKTLEAGSQQFVSKPHTQDLRNEIKTAFDGILATEVQAGRIGNVNGGTAYAIKCDAQNNPDYLVRQNKLIVDVQISLFAPADFLMITLDASEAKVITLQ